MAAQLQPGNTRKGNPWRLAVWGTAAGLLMIPAIAMQLGAEGVHWTAFDFVVMGTLLGSCCAAYEVATRMSGNTLYRLGFAVAIVLGFLLARRRAGASRDGEEVERGTRPGVQWPESAAAPSAAPPTSWAAL